MQITVTDMAGDRGAVVGAPADVVEQIRSWYRPEVGEQVDRLAMLLDLGRATHEVEAFLGISITAGTLGCDPQDEP